MFVVNVCVCISVCCFHVLVARSSVFICCSSISYLETPLVRECLMVLSRNCNLWLCIYHMGCRSLFLFLSLFSLFQKNWVDDESYDVFSLKQRMHLYASGHSDPCIHWLGAECSYVLRCCLSTQLRTNFMCTHARTHTDIRKLTCAFVPPFDLFSFFLIDGAPCVSVWVLNYGYVCVCSKYTNCMLCLTPQNVCLRWSQLLVQRPHVHLSNILIFWNITCIRVLLSDLISWRLHYPIRNSLRVCSASHRRVSCIM